MFHRVKSEADQQVVEPVEKSKAEVKIVKKVETPVENTTTEKTQTETKVEQKAEIQKTSTPQPQKEAETMNQPEKVQDDKTEAQTDIPASAYQRAGTAPASAPSGGYPGTAPAYPGYNAPNAHANASDRRLTIGAGITMSGEIEACDYLLVEGTVEAALKGASVLEIAETGVFYGTVDIEDATIAGRFEGDITAQGRLVLREGATVTGTIAYKELEIEAGAIIDGKLTPLTGVAAAVKPAPSSNRKEVKPAAAAKTQKVQAEKAPEPANTDGGLFSKAATAAE